MGLHQYLDRLRPPHVLALLAVGALLVGFAAVRPAVQTTLHARTLAAELRHARPLNRDAPTSYDTEAARASSAALATYLTQLATDLGLQITDIPAPRRVHITDDLTLETLTVELDGPFASVLTFTRAVETGYSPQGTADAAAPRAIVNLHAGYRKLRRTRQYAFRTRLTLRRIRRA